MTTGKKAAPANTQHAQSASQKDAAKNGFFSANEVQQPFFEAAQVRAKMTVNEPGDHFEKQADHVADKVVQHISQPKPVQSAAVQKKSDEKEDQKEKELNKGEKEVQRKPVFESDADPNEGDTLKRSSQSAAPDVSPQTQHRIESSKGGGEPLPANTREEMEGAMGTDLSAVRIHHGNEAADLSNQLQAQAFTHGNDIYFGQGKYDTQSQSGRHLLAHELTHTVQQGGSVKKKGVIQRTPTASTPTPGVANNGNAAAHAGDPPINKEAKTIKVPAIELPGFKRNMMPSQANYSFKKNTRSGGHLNEWETQAVSTGGFLNKFNTMRLAQLPNGGASPAGNNTYFMVSITAASGGLIFGNPEEIQRRSTRPTWRKNGQGNVFQVDHKVELQIGGADVDIGNLWLLSDSINTSSGGTIQGAIRSSVQGVLDANADLAQGLSAQSIMDTYSITADSLTGGGSPGSVQDTDFYTIDDIKNGAHLDGLRFLVPGRDDAQLHSFVDTSKIHLFFNERRGRVFELPKAGPYFIPGSTNYGLHINTLTYDPQTDIMQAGGAGSMNVSLFRNSNVAQSVNQDFAINPIPGIYGGFISRQSILSTLHPQLKKLSPVELQEADLDDNGVLEARGKVHTDIPLIDNADIDVVFDSNGIGVRKIFNGGEIHVPPPFRITDTSLGITLGDSGLTVNGNLNFEIERLGRGELHGQAGSSGDFALGGSFDFDSQTFNPARITVSYTKPGAGAGGGGFSATGDIGMPEGKIRGLKTAHIHVEYANQTLTASGTAEPDIKGVRQAAINVSYGDNQLVIGGSFQLDENIPGIQSGSGTVQVTRGPDGIYHVAATGTAVPRIPHINTSLSINYDDGALTLEGTAAYTADRVSGNVTVGATNRAIGADGTPSGPAGDHFTAYGSGSLTLRVTDWLQATATVRVTPAGEIEVVGRLELPSSVDVFPQKAINKNLFTAPTIQIPLFAIPLGPRSIGLVATINGGLDFEASVGPGQLRNVFGQIEFNPSHPEDTRISGGAQFVIPAHAGITLHADLGIGLSVAAASVTGGIEIRGGLGLEGEASASADLAWSPTSGFEFNALGQIEVHPQFTFDVNALLRASLDLGVTSLSKEWRHNLAAFSYGPDIQLGVSLPVHYKDGEPFDISTDDIQVTYPHIDIPQMASGLANQISNAII